MSVLSPLLLSCGALACVAVPAATTLTVHNQTGQTLVVTRPWSPWRPEPDDPPMRLPYFQRWLKPGDLGTYCFQIPGKDLDSRIVVRHLPVEGVIDFEGMTISAGEPGLTPISEELPPEPQAPGMKSPGGLGLRRLHALVGEFDDGEPKLLDGMHNLDELIQVDGLGDKAIGV